MGRDDTDRRGKKRGGMIQTGGRGKKRRVGRGAGVEWLGYTFVVRVRVCVGGEVNG